MPQLFQWIILFNTQIIPDVTSGHFFQILIYVKQREMKTDTHRASPSVAETAGL